MSATWDLSSLYRGPDDARIDADLAAVKRAAAHFVEAHRGRVATFDARGLASALTAYEDLDEAARRPGFYAHLLFAPDTQDDAARRLVDRTPEAALGMSTA